MDNLDVHKAGSTLIIETGEYSDRIWNGPVRVLKDFTKQEDADQFRSEFVKQPDDYREGPDPYDFLPWLVTKGYVESIDNCSSWHVGSYGDFQPY